MCVFSQDATVFGGALGEVYGQKIVKVMDLALKSGCPVVGLNEGSGARIQEGIAGLALYGEIFYRNTLASGVVPQISLVLGNCAGGHVYSPALTDFTLMVDQASAMMITGPDVIKTVTGEDISIEDLGGARAHNSQERRRALHERRRGRGDRAHQGAAVATCRRTTSTQPPVLDGARRARRGAAARARHARPGQQQRAVRHARRRRGGRSTTASSSRCRRCGRSRSSCGFGRVEGRSVGVVANNPMHFAGTLDIDASEKAARFVRTCDAFDIPV